MADKKIKQKEMEKEIKKLKEIKESKEMKEKKIEKAKVIAKTEREKAEQAIHAAIRNLLILNKKSKIKMLVGIGLAKKEIIKNKIKIKKYEIAVKTEPKLAQFYREKANELKAKNVLLIKITNSFIFLEPVLNKEIGWLTNEAGALHTKNMAIIKKAVNEESACLIKQRDLLIALFKLIKTLKVKKAVLKKKEKTAEKQ